jgi:hypothetical protein
MLGDGRRIHTSNRLPVFDREVRIRSRVRRPQAAGKVAAACRTAGTDGASIGNPWPRSTATNCTAYWHQGALGVPGPRPLRGVAPGRGAGVSWGTWGAGHRGRQGSRQAGHWAQAGTG